METLKLIGKVLLVVVAIALIAIIFAWIGFKVMALIGFVSPFLTYILAIFIGIIVVTAGSIVAFHISQKQKV